MSDQSKPANMAGQPYETLEQAYERGRMEGNADLAAMILRVISDGLESRRFNRLRAGRRVKLDLREGLGYLDYHEKLRYHQNPYSDPSRVSREFGLWFGIDPLDRLQGGFRLQDVVNRSEIVGGAIKETLLILKLSGHAEKREGLWFFKP